MNFLKKKIINFEPRIFGMDLSDLSVKVFQIETEGGYDHVRGYGSVNIPLGNIEDGRILHKENVAKAIREVLNLPQTKKIKSKKVICSLPESKAFVRIISIPKMSKEEAREAVKWEMEANMPMAISEVYFDWQFIKGIDEGDSMQRVLTAAISKEIVDDLMAVLAMAGLEVYGLEIESIASIRSLIDGKAEQEKTTLIVDLGANRTSFIIAEGFVPYFTSSIPFSSDGMNDAICKTLKLTPEEAEEAKMSNGIENSDKKNPIFKAVESLLENLVTEILKTMDFYGEMSNNAQEIDEIILCGGGSNMKGMPEFLAQKINKAVVVGNPWINLKLNNDLPIINKDNSARYVTAIGLALRGARYGD
ncbi:MAG: type IV pilus assembly protein PilM [Parcubacteria group bacterium]|jgi:type IV pilus assembly protein PilM